MAANVVLVERRDAVATVTLNRPEKRNALSTQMNLELYAAIRELDADGSIRAIVLTGADPAFCAGIDLTSFEEALSTSVGTPPDGSAPQLGMLPAHDTPVIGAINGPAATGGLELALSCDFLIASERARFADTHTRVGVMPAGGITVRLPRLIGIDRARRMSLTGDYVDAKTALAWGLITEVTPHDELVGRAQDVAATIAGIDPLATRAIRHLYEEVEALSGNDAWLAEIHRHDEWMKSSFDSTRLEQGRTAIIERGSAQG